MAKINNQPPRAPLWPWGGPRAVREKLVEPSQFDRKKRKAGNPKNPALASAALLDFIGPAHSSEELRLPTPPQPRGHDADLEGFSDRPFLGSVAGRADTEQRQLLERSLSLINTTPERMERLKGLLQREAQMLSLVSQVHADIQDIQRRMREEQQEEGY
ncbi:hypothetical protein D187_004378 [Cystobacter fuscus DSM 2262]|uniref:Uncharacterized protein n=1 Tax=Cystobacter fuscus (strain ATCC 25194 / DSM 2262 / NBRC 100088 / M29) TaxID=1242864 RepID=S9Q9T6_CYSF2|nr:hypothetical protein [Cystobacter fuscus]EPX58089.1 hypothetical protein D187_004378 [Cystobacter fuscus DSM 2262]WNG24980.1 hypothetical protein F0U62_13905 [Cystobacter fuscus]